MLVGCRENLHVFKVRTSPSLKMQRGEGYSAPLPPSWMQNSLALMPLRSPIYHGAMFFARNCGFTMWVVLRKIVGFERGY